METTMDRVDVMLEPVRAFLVQVGAFLPSLAVAIVVLLVGFLLAKAARFAVQRGLRAINFHIVTERSGLDGFLQRGGTQADTAAVLAALVYWLVIFAALVVAFNGMGLAHVTDLLSKVMLFLPKVIVAVLILAFGAYFARFVGNAVVTYCRGVGLPDARALGALSRYAILVFVVMIAFDQLDIGGRIISWAFLIVLGGLVLALALAFGLGGQGWAAAHLERWWPSPKATDEEPPR
jgi:hypothetical protein